MPAASQTWKPEAAERGQPPTSSSRALRLEGWEEAGSAQLCCVLGAQVCHPPSLPVLGACGGDDIPAHHKYATKVMDTQGAEEGSQGTTRQEREVRE